MSTSGEPPFGAGGVNGPDWIDEDSERVARQAGGGTVGSSVRLPIVPDQAATPAPSAQDRPLVESAPNPSDGLGEIRWADSPQVTPASTPVVVPQATVEAVPTGLVPEAVGRSAWVDELSSIGDSEPDGWEKLSWQDLDEEQPIDTTPLQKQTNFGRILREWGPVLFAAVVIALFVRLVLVQAYHIPSGSMIPTLETGDRVVVNRLSYQFGEIDRGQVVVFSKPQGTDGENDLIKRVIGLPGETIRFVDDQVYINGFRVIEPYLAEPDSTRPRLTIPGCAQVTPAADLCVIPEGHIFMMGDNRLGSSDSRVFGPIEIDAVVGRAFMRVWPLNHLGQL
ncbi:MAG: signal peptidase I [Acidimicrobiales bacterium]